MLTIRQVGVDFPFFSLSCLLRLGSVGSKKFEPKINKEKIRLKYEY